MGKIPPRLSGGACNVLYMHQKCHSSSTTRVANCESGANKCRHCTLALKLEHPEPQLTPPSISSLTFTCPRNKPLMSRTMFLIFLGGTYLEKGKSLSAMFIWTSTNHNQGESWPVGWQGGVGVEEVWIACTRVLHTTVQFYFHKCTIILALLCNYICSTVQMYFCKCKNPHLHIQPIATTIPSMPVLIFS